MIKREYRCFFEGQQEKMYFNHLRLKINEAKPNVSIKFREVSKLTVLERSVTAVPKIAVFDYDMNKTEFEKKVKICKKTKVLYSNLNFDLWILLHKSKFEKTVQNNSAYIKLVREAYNLSKNSNIKSKQNIEKILKCIEIEDIKNAIENAEIIMKSKLQKDRIEVNKKFSYYDNPSINVNNFIKELFKECGI